MHKNNIKLAKTPRRLLTATMGFVFMISLSACSTGNDDKFDELMNSQYTSIGNLSVSKNEIWNELKWSADSKLEQYINNVILDEKIKNITEVLNNSGHEDYNEYSKRIIDYVVQDIYNFSYDNDSYWDNMEGLEEIDKLKLEKEYVDGLYTTYNISTIESQNVLDLIANASEEDTKAYMTIAKELSEVYYPSYAKELFAKDKKLEEVAKADEEDEDADDDKFGNYTTSNYVSEFENEFANQFDLDLLVIRFSSKEEYEDTLRAFGVKVYNKKYHFIKPTDDSISYTDYCNLYDKTNVKSQYEEVTIETITDTNKILELYVEMYNYLYDGYRNEIPTNYVPANNDNTLNGLRSITEQILANESTNETLVETIKTNNSYSHYTHEDLDEISSSFANYAYNTLDLEETMYSTSAQSYNNNYYLVYKLGQGENPYSWYNKDLTNDEIFTEIQKDETLFANIKENLINNDLTSTAIDAYLTEELENVKVKIYEEAVEISYSLKAEDYSKTHGKAPEKNVLATIEYNDKKWNLHIFKELAANDENSLVIPGKETHYGIYDDLEVQYGQTTAIDLLATKCITDENSKYAALYNQVKEENREFYTDYIEALLYNFTNEAYSYSGYPASIGKYNFLMLYFHNADINYIVDNYYCVQHTTNLLLTDYSKSGDKSVISFLKTYADKAYDNYFSLTGKRFVVYFDKDDNNEADDISTWTNELKALAQELIVEVMAEVYASTDSHANTFNRVIKEINGSARVAFDENPVLVENQWAKYRKAGLNVKLEDFSVTNSTYDVDKNLKDRLAAYVKEDSYELIKNNTVPTEFIEKDAETKPVVTNDGYNVLLVTGASLPASAKWSKVENEDTLLQDIHVKYNEKDVTVENIWNEEDKLNENQIRLYVLQYVSNGSSSLTPAGVTSAINSFLTPVLSRYTADETQRIIIKYFIESTTGNKYTNERFDKLLEINQQKADNNTDLYQEVYETVEGYNQFTNWWTDLEQQVENFLSEIE